MGTQLVPTTETPTSSSRESTFTTTKQLEAVTSQEPFSWILNQVPWTQSEPDHSDSSSDQTTSSSMLSERKPKVATASKDSRSLTPSVVVLDPVWEPSSSPRSEKSTQTDRWSPTLLCHHQRYPIPSLSHTTPLCPSISLSRTPMMSCALTTRLFTISASEPSS